jgi:hypothetical protein
MSRSAGLSPDGKMPGYRETDSVECWVRSTFEAAWEGTSNEYERDRLRSALEDNESLSNWAESYLRLAMPSIINTLFQAIMNSVDWWTLRHTLFEFVLAEEMNESE